MSNWLQRLLPKSAFARGVGVLVGGTAVAQLFTMLAAPVITRLYSPEAFGLLAVFTAMLSLFSVVAAGRYDMAIALPENEQDAADLTALSVLLVFATTLVALVIFLLWAAPIATVLNAPGLEPYLWLIPVGIFFGGCYQVFNMWAIREKRFGIIAQTRIWQSLGTLAFQLGAYKLGVFGLVAGQAIGQGLGAGSLSFSALRLPVFRKFSISGLYKQAKRYSRFPKYSIWTALLNTAGLQLAPIAFIALHGATIAGQYALTHRILSMPGSLIGNAIGNVFLSSAPEAHRNNTLSELVKKLHSRLTMAGALPLSVLLLFGPDLFELIFGTEWRKAGVYAQWMAPWIYFQFQWSPLSTLSTVLEMQRQGLISQSMNFAFRTATLITCWALGFSSDTTILSFCIISALIYLTQLLWFARAAGVKTSSIITTNLKYISTVLPAVATVYFLTSFYNVT